MAAKQKRTVVLLNDDRSGAGVEVTIEESVDSPNQRTILYNGVQYEHADTREDGVRRYAPAR